MMGKLRKENKDTTKIMCPFCKSEVATKKIINGKPLLYCAMCRRKFKSTPI